MYIMTTTSNTQQATCRQTTALLKKYIKQRYGITCSIRSEFYSGGSSLRIEYQNGPESSIISSEVKRLQYGNFDGMTDSYDYKKDSETGLILDGKRLQEFKYVTVQRTISKDLLFQFVKMLSAGGNYFGLCEVKTEHDMFLDFEKPFRQCCNWSQLSRNYLHDANFVTSTSDIEIIDIIHKEFIGNFDIIYRHNNTLHCTTDLRVNNDISIKKQFPTQK